MGVDYSTIVKEFHITLFIIFLNHQNFETSEAILIILSILSRYCFIIKNITNFNLIIPTFLFIKSVLLLKCQKYSRDIDFLLMVVKNLGTTAPTVVLYYI